MKNTLKLIGLALLVSVIIAIAADPAPIVFKTITRTNVFAQVAVTNVITEVAPVTLSKEQMVAIIGACNQMGIQCEPAITADQIQSIQVYAVGGVAFRIQVTLNRK